MKECRKCKRKLRENAFSLKSNSKTIFSTCCDECRAKPAITWAFRNPEKMRDAVRRHQISGRARSGRLKAKYQMTVEQYENLLKEQGGVCAICASASPGGKWTVFHVDHDHATGYVRGLLCTNCNRGIGYMGDDPSRLRIAAEYLSR